MGRPSPPEETLLFTGALYCQGKYLSLARERLEALFGEIAIETDPISWEFSNYYEQELGRPILRNFLFFRDRINPETLGSIKLATNEIEHQLSDKGRRNINLDPGYMTSSKVVLASTKNYSHRIYLSRGIFAEVTLVYRDGRYRPHLFTYRDFCSDEYAEIFENARKLLE